MILSSLHEIDDCYNLLAMSYRHKIVFLCSLHVQVASASPPSAPPTPAPTMFSPEGDKVGVHHYWNVLPNVGLSGQWASSAESRVWKSSWECLKDKGGQGKFSCIC